MKVWEFRNAPSNDVAMLVPSDTDEAAAKMCDVNGDPLDGKVRAHVEVFVGPKGKGEAAR